MITGVTRTAIVELFAKYDPDPMGFGVLLGTAEPREPGVRWWGDIDETAFLSRLYDLESMPSNDPRYDSASGDIFQHRENNEDWENDWIFYDHRFELQTSDAKLLRFLAETIHPEVRSDKQEVADIKDALNRLLEPDQYALKQRDTISGKPVYRAVAIEAKKVSALEIREAIAQAIRDCLKAYDVAGYCDSLDLPSASDDAVTPMGSKAGYVKDRLRVFERGDLVKLARKVQENFDYEPLEELLYRIDANSSSDGSKGNPKNLIFAAKGIKPEIYLSDSIDNDVGINKYADNILVYDNLIDPNIGLSWRELLDWWMKRERTTDEEAANRTLYTRLRETCNTPEKIILDTYGHILKEYGFDIPAIIPQIYLHFDPIIARQKGEPRPLFRQRMDFLMLMPNRVRVVIELDGVQHYSDANGKADVKLYAKTMEEDRKLRLRGYQVFRFGGADFVNKEQSKVMMRSFFIELLSQAGVINAKTN